LIPINLATIKVLLNNIALRLASYNLGIEFDVLIYKNFLTNIVIYVTISA